MFQTTQKSQTLLLNEQSRARQATGQKVYKLGFGQSPFLPPERVMQALRDAAHRKDYSPVQGLSELRINVANFHSHTNNDTILPQQVLIGAGSKILLFNTLMAFQSAVVLLPAPSWVSYKPQADLAGHQTHIIPTNYHSRWRIKPEQLEEILSHAEYQSRPKILILNYPGNPEGLTYTSDELKDIATILRKHEAWVISDEIYALLHHQGTHISIANYYPERTMITTGLSKWCGAGGWRLGVQIVPQDAPSELWNAILGVASETYSCAPTPIQVAATEAYQWDTVTATYLDAQRRILRTIGYHVQQQLSEFGIFVHPPEGGFYLLVNFSPLRDQLTTKDIRTDADLCATLLEETGVALLPGAAFGNSADSLTTRMAYVDFDGDAALTDVIHDENNLSQLLTTHCSHMLTGIQKLGEWLK